MSSSKKEVSYFSTNQNIRHLTDLMLHTQQEVSYFSRECHLTDLTSVGCFIVIAGILVALLMRKKIVSLLGPFGCFAGELGDPQHRHFPIIDNRQRY